MLCAAVAQHVGNWGEGEGGRERGGGRSTVLCKRVGLFEVVSAVYAQRREVFDGGEISRVYLGR